MRRATPKNRGLGRLPSATGVVLGLGLMWVLRQLVRSAGGAGSSFDPQWRAFALPLLILFVIGIVATWFPLPRARRIDPAQVLRSS